LDAAGRRRAAGVVEQRVESLVPVEHVADEALPVRFRGGVRLDETRVGTEPSGDRLAQLLAPAGEDHTRAFLHEQLRGALANAARRPGDDRDLAVEHAHDVLSTSPIAPPSSIAGR